MIVTEQVERYLVDSRPAPDELLLEMEAHAARDRIPIVVPETAAFIGAAVRSAGARRAVEVGTAIGYSTLLIARALGEGGLITSFEIDDERHRAAIDYLRRAGVADRVDLHLQDAALGLAGLEPGAFDMAFIDGQKGDYAGHLALVLPLLRRGGTVLVDNTLLSGAVADGRSAGHWTQEAVDEMRAFNARVLGDPDLSAALLPVGDGLLIAVVR